jgi:hypothetical protein
MNKVTPVQTEWMVSSTERQLEIDDSQEGVLVVGFLGYFGRTLVDGKMTDKYHDVKIEFTGVKEFRHFPDYSTKDGERLDSYDWELVPEFRDEEGSLAKHGETFQKVWAETGICPDPAFYEVAGSNWVEEVGESRNLKHYLVLGGDYNLEVLSEGIR